MLGAAVVLVLGGPADKFVGDDYKLVGDRGRVFYTLNLYATVPLIVLLTIAALVVVKREFEQTDGGSRWIIAGTTITLGYLYALIGVTMAHELTHLLDNKVARPRAPVMISLTLNASFMVYHIHGHHRNVGMYDDAATAWRGENAIAFIVRTIISPRLK